MFPHLHSRIIYGNLNNFFRNCPILALNVWCFLNQILLGHRRCKKRRKKGIFSNWMNNINIVRPIRARITMSRHGNAVLWVSESAKCWCVIQITQRFYNYDGMWNIIWGGYSYFLNIISYHLILDAMWPQWKVRKIEFAYSSHDAPYDDSPYISIIAKMDSILLISPGPKSYDYDIQLSILAVLLLQKCEQP